MKLIVGLGNPEEKYIYTRHNIGFMVIDRIVKNSSKEVINSGKEVSNGYLYQYDSNTLLLKPYTTMNFSGDCVKEIVENYNISIENDNSNNTNISDQQDSTSSILVIHDDTSLSFGKLRLRESGSDGRHKGMKSIIDSLGTNKINRLRIGIDKPKDSSIILYDYVLSNFSEDELKLLNTKILDEACNAVYLWLTTSCQRAMTAINK